MYKKELKRIYQDNKKIYDLCGYRTKKGGFIPVNSFITSDFDHIYINHTMATDLVHQMREYQRTSVDDNIHITNFHFTDKDSIDHVLSKNYGNGTLLVNFANPYTPGGGYEDGYDAQEEDICRKTNLYSFLKDARSKDYYKSNRSYREAKKNTIGIDNCLLTTNVTIFRGEGYELLDETKPISILTIAAPRLAKFTNHKTMLENENYIKALQSRIDTIFATAWFYGYENIILGAFGCGVFNNDPDLVSGYMMKNIVDNINYFENVDFAIKGNERILDIFKENYLKYMAMFKLYGRVEYSFE